MAGTREGLSGGGGSVGSDPRGVGPPSPVQKKKTGGKMLKKNLKSAFLCTFSIKKTGKKI